MATISLYFDKKVPDELKAIFIEYAHRHLARYGCEVSRDRRYVCPDCGKPVKDLDAVRKRLAAKKDFITCQECDEKVPLMDFIEQRLKSDPVARKILAMDETATRELDTQALEKNPHRPHDGHRWRGEPNLPPRDHVRPRHRWRSGVQGRRRQGEREAHHHPARERQLLPAQPARATAARSST